MKSGIKKRAEGVTMAEFEVEATITEMVDIEIDFSKYTYIERIMLISAINRGDKHTFESIEVEVTGDTIVEIEPHDYH